MPMTRLCLPFVRSVGYAYSQHYRRVRDAVRSTGLHARVTGRLLRLCKDEVVVVVMVVVMGWLWWWW